MAAISRGWRCIDQSEGSRCRPTNNGIFREESGIKKLCHSPTRPWFDEATGARSGVPKNNELLSIANHLGTFICRIYAVCQWIDRFLARLGVQLLLPLVGLSYCPPAWLTVRSIFESRGFETQQSQNCTTQRGCRTRGWLPEATCGVGGACWSFQSINYWELRHEFSNSPPSLTARSATGSGRKIPTSMNRPSPIRSRA